MRGRRHGELHGHRTPRLGRTLATAVESAEERPLLRLLVDASRGRFPADDGLTEVVPSPPGPCDAVVGFTAHHVVAAGVGAEEVAAALPTDDLGAAMDARFLAWLGERLGTPPGMIDAVLAADAVSGPAAVALRPVSSQVSNARVQRASRYRRDLRVFKDDAASAFVTLGRGLAGRLEVSIEVEPDRRDAGFGRTLAEAARTLCPPDEPVFAQVTPGNARSLRAFLAAGFRPIGSEVLFLRARPSGSAGP